MNSIPQLVKYQAQHAPDAAAILAAGFEDTSFADLSMHISRLARQLNASGVKRNDRIAIVLPNGADMAVAFLAVASVATSAPLNPAFSAHEFEFYLRDLNAKAVIVSAPCDTAAKQVAGELGIAVFELQTGEKAGQFYFTGEDGNETVQADFAQADDIAMVLHTSGTTSRPKMVPLSHRNLCSSAMAVAAALQLTPQDRCLNVMPLFHIHGLVAAVLTPLVSGGSIVCSAGFQAERFFTCLEIFKPTWYTAVPTIHQAVLGEALGRAQAIAENSLRFIRSSSASLPPNVMHELEKLFHVPVIEAYGMTEASHQMASNPLPPLARKAGSVGVAAGPEVAIMEEAGSGLLPPGKNGEIVIRGDNVTSGYDNNPDANAAAFNDGWFRTGDQGYFDADGYLFITGRLKEMINRGGEKIAPREVDEALLEHPAVAQAVAFAVKHESLGEDLVAAIILHQGATATEQELRQHAFRRLADYKVPSQILLVDAIPKGATGKLQRIGLAEKLKKRLGSDVIAPGNEIEEKVVEVMQEVMGHGPCSVTANFFVSGGDSLKGAQVTGRLSQFFQIELSNTALFHYPTAAGLALEIKNQLDEERELMDLAAELEQLPEDEMKRVLAEIAELPA